MAQEGREENFLLWQNLKEDDAYLLAMELGKVVWDIVDEWQWFEKRSMGFQYVESSDSVAANISEGWGRYFYKDKYNFFRIARGSLLESMTWTAKAYSRNLILENHMNQLKQVFDLLPFEINRLMKRCRSSAE